MFLIKIEKLEIGTFKEFSDTKKIWPKIISPGRYRKVHFVRTKKRRL